MKNLEFKRLVVASDTLKSGNQFEFKPRFNLITANDNSFGKSTLGKVCKTFPLAREVQC